MVNLRLSVFLLLHSFYWICREVFRFGMHRLNVLVFKLRLLHHIRSFLLRNRCSLRIQNKIFLEVFVTFRNLRIWRNLQEMLQICRGVVVNIIKQLDLPRQVLLLSLISRLPLLLAINITIVTDLHDLTLIRISNGWLIMILWPGQKHTFLLSSQTLFQIHRSSASPRCPWLHKLQLKPRRVLTSLIVRVRCLHIALACI